MTAPAPTALCVATDPLLRQAEHLFHDFKPRAAALLLTMFLASGTVPILHLAASLAAFSVTELSQYILQRRLLRAHATWERPAFVVNAFVAACVFSTFPLLIWYSDTATGHVMGLGMMLTAVIHCILIRSHHLGVGMATMVPLLLAMVIAVGPKILDHGAANADLRQSDMAILSATLYCMVCIGYLLHSAIGQSREKRRMVEALFKAEAAGRAKGRFLTSMSHEIRTPLNGILGIAQINRDAAKTKNEAELAETLLSSGQILKSMVDDILDHAKIEAGKLDLHPAPTDLRQLCDDIVRLYEANAEEKSLELVVDVAPDVPTFVLADRLRLHQIIANLISNAVKFTSFGAVRTVVSILAAQAGSLTIEIAVEDSGKGLTQDEITILFDAFTQVGGESDLAAKGTGLGLPISQNLAHLMGGDITVTSTPGAGARFALVFSTQRVEDVATKMSETSSGPSLCGMSALLAEDNRTNRLVLKAFLRGTDVKLTETENGAEAVKAAGEQQFDLILLDIRMPVMDGATAFQALRAQGVTTPIFALTANTMPEDRARYLELGMDGYLPKPLNKSDAAGPVTILPQASAGILTEQQWHRPSARRLH